MSVDRLRNALAASARPAAAIGSSYAAPRGNDSYSEEYSAPRAPASNYSGARPQGARPSSSSVPSNGTGGGGGASAHRSTGGLLYALPPTQASKKPGVKRGNSSYGEDEDDSPRQAPPAKKAKANDGPSHASKSASSSASSAYSSSRKPSHALHESEPIDEEEDSSFIPLDNPYEDASLSDGGEQEGEEYYEPSSTDDKGDQRSFEDAEEDDEFDYELSESSESDTEREKAHPHDYAEEDPEDGPPVMFTSKEELERAEREAAHKVDQRRREENELTKRIVRNLPQKKQERYKKFLDATDPIQRMRREIEQRKKEQKEGGSSSSSGTKQPAASHAHAHGAKNTAPVGEDDSYDSGLDRPRPSSSASAATKPYGASSSYAPANGHARPGTYGPASASAHPSNAFARPTVYASSHSSAPSYGGSRVQQPAHRPGGNDSYDETNTYARR